MLVDESSSGISVAKSTLEDPSLIRPKPSISTAAAQSSGTTLTANVQSSPTAVVSAVAGRSKNRHHRPRRDASAYDEVLLGLHESSSNSFTGDGDTDAHITMLPNEHVAVDDDDDSRITDPITNQLPAMWLSVTNQPDLNVFDQMASSPSSGLESFDDMLPQNDGPVIDSDSVDIDFVSLENMNRVEPSVHAMDDEVALPVPLVPYVVESHPSDRIKYEMHDANSHHEEEAETAHNSTESNGPKSMQRILVNVSIATDSGSGTQHHAVYMLHVSVPAGPQFDVVQQETGANSTSPVGATADTAGAVVDDNSCQPPEPPPVPPCPCDCSSPNVQEDKEDFNEPTSVSAIDETTTIATELATNPIESTTIDPSLACLYAQEIPTILILEGEPYLSRAF